ncbi:protein FAM135B-like isoform X2 [Phalaenopsis equestris]|uniref:protein FAM135B-like isoform X2 n=1 Tax=Phalaenopsis equestris TaxID=78828 RepID=UPI0009E523C2|nr:protein FAM135B-like isoform X2 [Phalaenopsis equestris]
MFRLMKCFLGLDPRNPPPRRLLDANSLSTRRSVEFRQPDMLEMVHEIAIYIHRFHNLDLFQQGWYQVKASLKWEDDSQRSRGTPSRVVQYEAPDITSDDTVGVWRIDDAEQSFTTQPFRIKYARQDVILSVMISFNLNIGSDEIPARSAVILKFELMYSPLLDNGIEMHGTFEAFSTAIHEFRIPPKALLGIHSYCPVHFDVYHAVLVDLSIHVVLLKAGMTSQKVPRDSLLVELDAKEIYKQPNQLLGQGINSREIELLKSLLISHESLVVELQKISSVIDQKIDDLTEADLNYSIFGLSGSTLSDVSSVSSNGNMGLGQAADTFQVVVENSNGVFDVRNDVMLYSLSKEEILDVFFSVGSQLSLLWNAFLKFHRAHRIKLIEHLRNSWAADRKAEWSIWMVHSKIEIPHRYLRSNSNNSSQRSTLGKAVQRKYGDDPAQSATARAELHRKSIAQMKINNRSIQDMQIFDENASPAVTSGSGEKNTPESSDLGKRGGRVLKVVVFVHGFQGHHLDLRLVRNQWLLLDPGTECLMSEVNEERTSGDLREMGSRLAEEVTVFVKKKIDKLSRYGGCKDLKLSFVGHSIGNIIIRTALADRLFDPYHKNLHTYMSVSGPHLGYWYSSNSLFNSGLWVLKKLKNSQCIHQLTFSDDADLQNTFFYKLCKQKTLENFKNIILLSSPQDGYVPYHSARIELSPASSSDNSKKAQIFLEMLNNCLDQIRAPSSKQRVFMRCDVNFDSSNQGKNLNTFIGRAAHIEFLETDIFAKFIMWSFPELFR